MNQGIQWNLPLTVFVLRKRALPDVQLCRQRLLGHIHILTQIPKPHSITPFRVYYMISQNEILTNITKCDIMSMGWLYRSKKVVGI